MYLGHFLEDEEIDPEKLSHLWMIEGLLLTGQSARGERMMDMTERYLRELTLKGLVEVQEEEEEVPATTKKFKACRFVQGMEKFCVSNCERKRFLKIVDLRREDCSLSSNDGPRRLVIYLGKHKVDISPKVESITNYMKTSSSNNWPLQLDCYAEDRHSVLREFLWCKVLRTLNFKGYIGHAPTIIR